MPNPLECDLLLAERGLVDYEALKTSRHKPLVNCYRNHRKITDKASMVKSLQDYAVELKIDPVTLMPSSFVFMSNYELILQQTPAPAPAAAVKSESVESLVGSSPADAKKAERRLSRSISREKILAAKQTGLQRNVEKERKQRELFIEEAKRNPNKIWIAKVSNGAKGEKICISRDPVEVLQHIDTTDTVDGNRHSQPWVVQQYVSSPFLINNRKFDIRYWVLVDSTYKIYAYRTGVCRTSSEAYDPSNLSNQFIHLTNHCIQEGHPNFGKEETGNELFFDAFDDYLVKSNAGPGRRVRDLKEQLNQLAVHSILALQPLVRQEDADNFRSFHFFGFDFLVDSNFRCTLLEINATPAAALVLLSDMAADVIRCVVDPLFPPQDAKYVEVLSKRQNQFDLIYTPAK